MAGDGSEGELRVDRDGRVVDVVRWPWGPHPAVGDAVVGLFEEACASVVRLWIAHGWRCLDEYVLLLARDEVHVRLWAEDGEDSVRLLLRDVSAGVVIERCAERRRRSEALIQLAGSLARELSNPLAVVLFRLELMLELKTRDPERLVEDLQIAFDHTRRVTAVLRNLRSVGRFPGPSETSTRLSTALDTALVLLGAHAEHVEIDLDRQDLEVGGEEGLVGSVCGILLRRILDTVGLTTIVVSARAHPNGWLAVDLGPAIAAQWDPRKVIEEAGLASTLLDAIGGDVRPHTSNGGPRVQLWLPQPVGRPQKARTVFETLLVVGANIGPYVTHMLAHDGFAFLFARTAEEAIDWSDRCQAALVELVLEGPVSGRHVADALCRTGGKRVVLVADGPLPKEAIPVGATGLGWPATRDDLLVALGRARR